nr:uncharacterized protein LOC108012425 isoform X3 [Drosophila suzukii]
MRLFLILLLVSVTLGNKKALRCLKDCPIDVFDVSCSFDKFCYFEAENQCHVDIEKCLRRAYNKPDRILLKAELSKESETLHSNGFIQCTTSKT